MDKELSKNFGGGVSKKAMRRSPTSRNERRKAIAAKKEHPLGNAEVQAAIEGAIIEFESWREQLGEVKRAADV